MTPPARRLGWLLVPAPPLSVAYLLSIRAHAAPARFWPVVLLGLLPVVVLVVAVVGGSGLSPRRRMTLGAVAVLEIAWVLVAASAVGLAIGLASG